MFVVMPHTVRFTRPGREPTPRTYWDVVDRDAGHNDRFFPNRVAASCRDEADALRICNFLNGADPHATHYQREVGLQKLRADMLRDELADARKALEQERNVSSDQAGIMREHAIKLHALRRDLDEANAALQRERDQMDVLCQRATERTVGVTLADYITHCEYTLKYTREQSSRASAMLADLSRKYDEMVLTAARAQTELAEARGEFGKPAEPIHGPVYQQIKRQILDEVHDIFTKLGYNSRA